MSPKVWEASGPRRRLLRRPHRVHELPPPLPRRPSGRRRVPRVRRHGVHEAEAVQPDVQDPHGPGRGRRQRHLPAVPRPRRGSSWTSPRADRGRKKVPFGIAQIGKSFRNEITPGNFIFRTREFEQMEMEYFVKPGTRRGVVRSLDRATAELVPRSRCAQGQGSSAGRTSRTSSRTTPRRRPTSNTSSRSDGPSSRGSTTGPTSICSRTQEVSGQDLDYFDQEAEERY